MYERRNNRTNQRHWIQQGGNDHRSEKRERNHRLKEWNPTEDDPRTIRPMLQPTNNQTHASMHTPNQKPTLPPTTPLIHTDPRRENRGRPSDHNEPLDHIEPMTNGPPLLNQNHCRTRIIVGSHPSRERRERRKEREERTKNGKRESCENKKLIFFFTI